MPDEVLGRRRALSPQATRPAIAPTTAPVTRLDATATERRREQAGRDLDLASYGIVTAQADGTWTPKRAYHALARQYRGTP